MTGSRPVSPSTDSPTSPNLADIRAAFAASWDAASMVMRVRFSSPAPLVSALGGQQRRSCLNHGQVVWPWRPSIPEDALEDQSGSKMPPRCRVPPE
jgi:hypothetical protein